MLAGISTSNWEHLLSLAARLSESLSVPRIRADDGPALYAIVLMQCLSSSRQGEFFAVDAGAGVGYSTLWIVRALEEQGCNGRVVAVEHNLERFEALKKVLSEVNKVARKVFAEAFLGDALEYVKSLPSESADLLFVDVEKSLYPIVLRASMDKVKAGGTILFHNAYMVMAYMKEVLGNTETEGFRVALIPSQEGILFFLKERGEE